MSRLQISVLRKPETLLFFRCLRCKHNREILLYIPHEEAGIPRDSQLEYRLGIYKSCGAAVQNSHLGRTSCVDVSHLGRSSSGEVDEFEN
jgi:hypothetical protein